MKEWTDGEARSVRAGAVCLRVLHKPDRHRHGGRHRLVNEQMNEWIQWINEMLSEMSGFMLISACLVLTIPPNDPAEGKLKQNVWWLPDDNGQSWTWHDEIKMHN